MHWFTNLCHNVGAFGEQFALFAEAHWAGMTPAKYTCLIISVGLIGFLMMGRGSKAN